MSRGEIAGVGTDDVTRAVVEAVADAEGVDPEALAPPLYEAIDPDALNRIFAATPTADRTAERVGFRYSGYEVTIYGDGSVSVESREG